MSGAADKGRAAAAMPGVLRLRRERGPQKVSFDQVADHLVDFSALFPATRSVIDHLAGFLAKVEDVPHDHDAPAGSAGI